MTTTTEAPLSPCEQARRQNEIMRNNPYVMMADQPVAQATTMEEVSLDMLQGPGLFTRVKSIQKC